MLISLLSLVGIAFVPFQNESFRHRFLSPALSFAVGALLGDAVLHLLPAAFGIHEHSDEAEVRLAAHAARRAAARRRAPPLSVRRVERRTGACVVVVVRRLTARRRADVVFVRRVLAAA